MAYDMVVERRRRVQADKRSNDKMIGISEEFLKLQSATAIVQVKLH